MLQTENIVRNRFQDSPLPQQILPHQNSPLNSGIRQSPLVEVDDYDFFKSLTTRRSKVCKFLKIYCSNLKQDFSDYFKATVFLPLAAISGTVMAAASGIYLGVLSGGFRPKLIIPTLLATQVVVPHGIVGGLAVGTTTLTAGVCIKSFIRTIKIVRMPPTERLLASYRNAYNALKSLTAKGLHICKPPSETDMHRAGDLKTFMEQRKPACLSALADKGASAKEYQSLGLTPELAESPSVTIHETTV